MDRALRETPPRAAIADVPHAPRRNHRTLAIGIFVRTFKFSLEALLTYRRHIRDLRRLVLSRVHEESNRLESEHRRLQQSRLALLGELRSHGQGGNMDVDFVTRRRFFAGQLSAEIHGVDQHRRLVAQQAELCRQQVVEADRNVKLLEKLKDRQLAEFAYQQERKSERERDDLWLAARAGEFAR